MSYETPEEMEAGQGNEAVAEADGQEKWIDFAARCPECKTNIQRVFNPDCNRCGNKRVILVQVRESDLYEWMRSLADPEDPPLGDSGRSLRGKR